MRDWENNIRRVVPYTPGEQPKNTCVIKLNTNENPYPPAPGVKEVLSNFNTDDLRLYPDPRVDKLVNAIADFYKIDSSKVFVGVGSDDVLAMIFMTFFNSKKPILFPDITYSFYDVWCNLYQIPFERIPLNEKFEFNIEDYKRENGGIVITNPNAPTGIYMELESVEEIIKANPDSIVIVDEAYIDFGGKSAIDLIHKYENLVVVQTYSKSRALAGIRMGYAMANSYLIDAMKAVKNSFNSYTITTLSQDIATASAKDSQYLKECTDKIKSSRKWTVDELDKLGFETLPSSANFIFTTNKNIDAKDLFEYLKEHRIFVRYFNKPRINQYLRITIGTQEQMEALVKAIKEYK